MYFFETPNPSILAASASSYYISFFFLFLFSHFLPCSSGEETPFVQLSNGIGFRTGFSYWCPIKRSLCKHGTASLSRTHLLEYNASLMSQKGRLFLAQFHYNGRKSCWSWMDDGWSGHPTRRTTRLHKRKEKGPPFSAIFSRTCWTRKRSLLIIDLRKRRCDRPPSWYTHFRFAWLIPRICTVHHHR